MQTVHGVSRRARTAGRKYAGRNAPEKRAGVTTVETILVVILVCLCGVAVWTKFGTQVSNKVNEATKKVADLKNDVQAN